MINNGQFRQLGGSFEGNNLRPLTESKEPRNRITGELVLIIAYALPLWKWRRDLYMGWVKFGYSSLTPNMEQLLY